MFVFCFAVKPLISIQDKSPVDEGQSGNFSAEAQQGRPAPTVRWLYDGEPVHSPKFTVHDVKYFAVQEDETITSGQTCTLNNAQRTDNGKHVTFEFMNEALEAPKTSDIEIKVNCK